MNSTYIIKKRTFFARSTNVVECEWMRTRKYVQIRVLPNDNFFLVANILGYSAKPTLFLRLFFTRSNTDAKASFLPRFANEARSVIASTHTSRSDSVSQAKR